MGTRGDSERAISGADDEGRWVDLGPVIAGDRGARASFVEAHARLVHAVVTRTLRRHEPESVEATIEDLFAESFVALFERDARRLRQWNGRCSLASWVRVVATSTVIDHLRRRRPERVQGIEHLPDAQPPLLELIVRAEDHVRVRAALNELSPVDRDLLVALFVDEEPVAALCARLGIAAGALYTRKNRALERLRTAYEGLAGR